jgi:DNA repair exonuclease SbcCD ATPase subunit
MAVEKIRFELGSVFNGKGFEDANKAIERNNKTLGSVTRGLGELSRAFGSIIPEAAGAAGSVGNFINGFVTGGIVGGAISAAMELVTAKIREIKTETDEFVKRISALPDVFSNDLAASIAATGKEFDALAAKMRENTAEAKDLLQVLNGAAASEAQNKIYEVKMRMYEKLDTALTDADKAIVRAAAEKEIALIRAAEAEKRAANQIELLMKQESDAALSGVNARSRLSEATKQLEEVELQYAGVFAERQRLEERLIEIDRTRAQYAGRESEYIVELTELQKEEIDIRTKLSTFVRDHAKAYELLNAVNKSIEEAKKQEAAAAREQVKAQNALILAQQALTKAVQDGEISEREANMKLKEAKEKVTKALMEQAEARHKLWEEEQRKKQLQEAAIEDENRKRREEREKKKEETKKPKAAAGADAWANVKVDVNVDNVKINEGQVATFGEHQAQLREEARKSRYEFNEYKARFGNDFARYAQMLGKPDSWLSERDRQLRDYMNNVVLKEMDSDLAARLFQDAAKRVLLPSDLEKFLGNRSDVVKTIEKLKAR